MIQIDIGNTASSYTNYAYLDLYDKMTNADYKVLWTITSQLTGNSKTFVTTTDYTYKERYMKMTITSLRTAASENFLTGTLNLGNTDFPLGFYDVTIYQNTSDTNLDPDGLTQIYSTLMNLKINSSANTSVVDYKEYTDNDTEINNVYLTSTPHL
tara:strand:+ start:67 stop:531 length:465 start_codon:yes stop_codon:yes gene_type:complete